MLKPVIVVSSVMTIGVLKRDACPTSDSTWQVSCMKMKTERPRLPAGGKKTTTEGASLIVEHVTLFMWT